MFLPTVTRAPTFSKRRIYIFLFTQLKTNFRRERSDDRKYVCTSPAKTMRGQIHLKLETRREGESSWTKAGLNIKHLSHQLHVLG